MALRRDRPRNCSIGDSLASSLRLSCSTARSSKSAAAASALQAERPADRFQFRRWADRQLGYRRRRGAAPNPFRVAAGRSGDSQVRRSLLPIPRPIPRHTATGSRTAHGADKNRAMSGPSHTASLFASAILAFFKPPGSWGRDETCACFYGSRSYDASSSGLGEIAIVYRAYRRFALVFGTIGKRVRRPGAPATTAAPLGVVP